MLLYYLLLYYFEGVFAIGTTYFLEQFDWIGRRFKRGLGWCSGSVVIGIFIDWTFEAELFMVFHL